MNNSNVILVTGGTGFLGRSLVGQLLQLGKKIRVVGRSSVNPWQDEPSVQYLKGDISAPGVLEIAITDVKEIYHLAAAMEGDWSVHKSVTVDALSRLLTLFSQQGGGRFVLVSSIMVYDTSLMGNDQIVNENHPISYDLSDVGDYSRAKIESEKIAQGYLSDSNVSLSIARPGIIYGPGMKNPLNGTATKVKGRLWAVLGSGRKQVPLIHVDDCSRALITISESEVTVGKAYNLVDPRSPSQHEYLKLYRSLNSQKFRVISIPALCARSGLKVVDMVLGILLRRRLDLSARAGRSMKRSQYNSDQMATDTGFKPNVSVVDGLADTVDQITHARSKHCYKFGIIGCGQIVRSVHLPAWDKIDSVQLTAICDSSQESLEAIGTQYPSARRYLDVDDFLNESDDLDFVVLATPGSTHVNIGEKILQKKLHLLCEKPIALNLNDAVRLYQIAEEEGVSLTPIHNYKYRDTVKKAISFTNKSEFGNPVMINIKSRSGSLSQDPATWRTSERKERVLLFDFGIHFVHMAIMLAGSVTSLRFVEAEENESGLKYVVFGTLHTNGCRGLFEFSIESRSAKAELEVLGESLGISIDFFPHGVRLLPVRDNPLHRGIGDFKRILAHTQSLVGERFMKRLPDRANPHKVLFTNFVNHLAGDANPISKEEVIETVRLLDEVADKAYRL